MSKVQGKDADLVANLTESGIASELESRLRDLEKNIAVAREFIKLADESYSELRHKWNLLQEEALNKSVLQTAENFVTTRKKATRSPKRESVETEETEPKAGEIGIKDVKEFKKSKADPHAGNQSRKRQQKPQDSTINLYPSEQLKNADHFQNERKKPKKDGRKS